MTLHIRSCVFPLLHPGFKYLDDPHSFLCLTHPVRHVDQFGVNSSQLDAVKPDVKQLKTVQVDFFYTAAINGNFA